MIQATNRQMDSGNRYRLSYAFLFASIGLQQQNDKELKAANVREAEGDLLASLKTFGTVAKNELDIVLTLPETLWTGPRTSTLVPQADGKRISLAEILTTNPDCRIAVESYTDSSGDPGNTQSVTEKQSYAVAEKFASIGIPEGRIVAKGLGANGRSHQI